MTPLQNEWESNRIENQFYAEIVADISDNRELKTWRYTIRQHEQNEPH